MFINVSRIKHVHSNPHSLMDDLDSAFDERDEVYAYEELDKSFLDTNHAGVRAKITLVYQILRQFGLPLFDRSSRQSKVLLKQF